MNRATYFLYRITSFILGNLPFQFLYLLSDFLAFVLYKILRYRRNIVESQLTRCFPEKSTQWRADTARASYQNLADVILESFKTDHLSSDQLRKRYHFTNPEAFNDLAKKGHNFILISAHCANWEWGSVGINLFLNTTVYGLYKPLKNNFINQFINEKRALAGSRLVPIRETGTLFSKPLQPSSSVVFIADQSPSNMVDAIWLEFMGQDTACLHGPEKYAQSTHWPVFYLHIERTKRGYYTVRMTQLDDGHNSITQQFMTLLEADLRRQPEAWLWTHKRWKRRREEGVEQQAKRVAKSSG